jgi:D-aminoacyl-tRNA deacylase
MLGIVVSQADSASAHIGEQLRAVTDWETYEDDSRPADEGGGTVYETDGAELREFESKHLDLVEPASAFEDPDLLVFASRHSGDTGPLLTAHHTGNVGPTVHGGADHSLATACPNALRAVFEALDSHAPPDYDVGIECTHHGPSVVGAPSMFVEVGSDEPQWDDPDAARAVARAILDLRGVTPHCPTENGDERRRQLVGIGGGHYAPRFTRILEETDWAVGHVLPDWGLDELDALNSEAAKAVFRDAFEGSSTAYGLVEDDRPELRECLDGLGYRAVTETWVRETTGVPLGFVATLEEELCSIADGLRFGTASQRDTEPEIYDVRELPPALVDEVSGIDRKQTYDALAETALAFTTDQGGTRPTGIVVLDERTTRETIIERLLTILAEKYDSVERDGETALARLEVFNPEKARTLGVPDGPKFGRLADGEAIEVDGETIPPDVVHDQQRETFPLE